MATEDPVAPRSRPKSLAASSLEERIERHLLGFLTELDRVPFTNQERERLQDPKILGRLTDDRSRPYFLYHFGTLYARAVRALLPPHSASYPSYPVPFVLSQFTPGKKRPYIIELGCGSGTGSLLLASLGARVLGLDLDETLISACRKRQQFYEPSKGPLDLRFEIADSINFDYRAQAPIDGVFSLFAFNLMQPWTDLLRRLMPALANDGRIVIADGNCDSLYNRLVRPREVPSPRQLSRELTRWGLLSSVTYHGIIPPAPARIPGAARSARLAEDGLNRLGFNRWLGVSYALVARPFDPQARPEVASTGSRPFPPVCCLTCPI
jgi:SAM-dependent methyltransferase